MTPSDSVVDALAEAMRLKRYGVVRPFWEDMEEDDRRLWRACALIILRLLSERGYTITRGRSNDT